MDGRIGVIRMVRKRWRGVAPYFYTVWPLLYIIPHLARSSRDAGPRYADLLRALKTPNLPSVSSFRRMMDDAGRETRRARETLSDLLPPPKEEGGGGGGGRVPAGNDDGRIARRSSFTTRRCDDTANAANKTQLKCPTSDLAGEYTV